MTVTELNAAARSRMEQAFPSVWVEAEIVNFIQARSGHWYFTLNDGTSQIKAACYRGSNYRIRFKPFDGLQVRVRGRLTVYEPRGEFQILVDSLKPVGEGALKVAFEQIREKLTAEGLLSLEVKRPLPEFPRRVGVVTSPVGAAFFDINEVLSRRARSVDLLLIPTLVQGENAGRSIADAIALANQFNASCERSQQIDVLIVGRGGGAREDLWAFNEEIVARAIRASNIPIISAVGHEIDVTIADLAADLRAPTPSAAAELVARHEQEVVEHLIRLRSRLGHAIERTMIRKREKLVKLEHHPKFVGFPHRLRRWAIEAAAIPARLAEAMRRRLRSGRDAVNTAVHRLSPVSLAGRVNASQIRLALLQQRHAAAIRTAMNDRGDLVKINAAKLDALSPLAVLGRGFSITTDAKGKVVRDAADVGAGDRIRVRLENGKIDAEVIDSGGTF